ncbi:SDR family oxidoreductase [Agrobacterium sp. NPDC058088]|uniref:SDR family oxidoreductase n=1 Tax=Agrobacterium sp. NPDC058088 TaxID=3346335 RepID=UPI0036D784A2
MTGTQQNKVALVVGATGIIGTALVQTLLSAPGWNVRALSRQPVSDVSTIGADLSDPSALKAALAAARDTTHVFYAALAPRPTLADENAVNGAMLRNLLDGLYAVGAPLRRIVLYQGAKVYGVHLGRVPSPFYEDENPRHMGPNFYFTQQDELCDRQAKGGPDWSILRPDVVVGNSIGSSMHIAMVIGMFAALTKASGATFRFPGSNRVYEDVLAQITDANSLARASLWAAQADGARNEAFNYVQSPFRWRRIWERIGEAFSLECGPPMPLRLANHMADKADMWGKMVRNSGLLERPFSDAVGWPFGDFVFNTEFDMVSDMGKIRRAGFHEDPDPAASLINAIRQLQEMRALPRL